MGGALSTPPYNILAYYTVISLPGGNKHGKCESDMESICTSDERRCKRQSKSLEKLEYDTLFFFHPIMSKLNSIKTIDSM